MESFPTCNVCGNRAKFKCPCGKRFYCCEECQKKDWTIGQHGTVCEAQNIHKDRFEMFLEENQIRPGKFALTPDGVNELAEIYKDEKYEFLKNLERGWRTLKYERKFKRIIDANEIWGNYKADLDSAKRLLSNFPKYLVDPKTNRRLLKEKFEKMVNKWSLL
jgi:hypothetical protein